VLSYFSELIGDNYIEAEFGYDYRQHHNQHSPYTASNVANYSPYNPTRPPLNPIHHIYSPILDNEEYTDPNIDSGNHIYPVYTKNTGFVRLDELRERLIEAQVIKWHRASMSSYSTASRQSHKSQSFSSMRSSRLSNSRQSFGLPVGSVPLSDGSLSSPLLGSSQSDIMHENTNSQIVDTLPSQLDTILEEDDNEGTRQMDIDQLQPAQPQGEQEKLLGQIYDAIYRQYSSFSGQQSQPSPAFLSPSNRSISTSSSGQRRKMLSFSEIPHVRGVDAASSGNRRANFANRPASFSDVSRSNSQL
jgi:hypothetical protein